MPATASMPWTRSYPPGLRWDSEIAVGSVGQTLEGAAARVPGWPAVDIIGCIFSCNEFGNLPGRTRCQQPSSPWRRATGAVVFTRDEPRACMKVRGCQQQMIGAKGIRAQQSQTAVGKLSRKALVDEEARRHSAAEDCKREKQGEPRT